MVKKVKMRSGLLIAAILASFVSVNAGWALEPTVFPGKGSRAVWNKACKVLNEGHAIAKSSEDAAIPKFQQAIAIYPYADCFFLDLGVSYEKKKKPELGKAEAAYRKAAELDPKDWRNWRALAGVLGQQEKYRECRDAGLKALACNPPDNEAKAMRESIKNLNEYLLTHK